MTTIFDPYYPFHPYGRTKPMTEYPVNVGLDEAHFSDIENAKRILSAAGYIVSPRPMEWREFSVLLTVKVQSRTFSEADFRRYVESVFENVDAVLLTTTSEKEVHAMGKITVKQYSRIVRKDEADDK